MSSSQEKRTFVVEEFRRRGWDPERAAKMSDDQITAIYLRFKGEPMTKLDTRGERAGHAVITETSRRAYSDRGALDRALLVLTNKYFKALAAEQDRQGVKYHFFFYIERPPK